MPPLYRAGNAPSGVKVNQSSGYTGAMSEGQTFKRGDRVLMRKHADWKSDAIGTVLGACRRTPHTAPGDWYLVQFDSPQRDYTDEMHGDDREYPSSTVEATYLESLDSK